MVGGLPRREPCIEHLHYAIPNGEITEMLPTDSTPTSETFTSISTPYLGRPKVLWPRVLLDFYS